MKQNETRDLISELLALPKFGNGIGLHRMSWICSRLLKGKWMSNLDAIKITGSNGKGSVCAMIAAIFEAMGIRYGLYTSPHLFKFNERIVIDGRPISDAELSEAINWFNSKKDEYLQLYPADTIGAFEAFTAMALYQFEKHKSSAVITEAGIGGRFDSTRIIPGRFVGLTSLDLEHTRLLGDTLEQIAYDKADLCPDFGTLVVGTIDDEILRRLISYCSLRNIRLIVVEDMCQIDNVAFEDTQMIIDLKIADMSFKNLKVGLQGYHQISNAAVAILLVREWLRNNLPELSTTQFREGIRKGLASVKCTGRFQKIHSNPNIFMDVGHTPVAMENLIRTVKAVVIDKPVVLVTGVSHDKEAEAIVSKLVTVASAVICTRSYHRGRSVSEIRKIVKEKRPDLPIFEALTIEEAVRLAKKYATEHNMIVLIAGGLFLAVEAMEVLKGNDPQELCFF